MQACSGSPRRVGTARFTGALNLRRFKLPVLEDAKKIAEQITGWKRPDKAALDSLIRRRKPHAIRFKDDGLVPNHPRWPLVVYRTPVRFLDELDPAAVFEELFAANGWDDSWRGGIYDYVHYHSRIHEVLGIARGTVKVLFGGHRGRTLSLKAGDVAILPAGTGHRCMGANEGLLAVGAYPATGKYDECRPNREDHDRALKTILRVGRPRKDPVYGNGGTLRTLWS
jgi:uncharacterized protein YjlB